MDRLGRVLLEVRPHDPDLEVAVLTRDAERAVDAERLVVLRDLVALRQVGIRVVLAVEERAGRDLAAEREPELERPFDRGLVGRGQRTWKGEAHGTGLRVRLAGEAVRTAAEHLRPRLQLDMD